jgi:serine/threonine protein kinase
VGSTADAFQATMRVVEEAKHLMELRHPNILEYRDVFGHHALDQNFVCILMELCDGGTLSDVVFDLGLDLGGIVDVCRQLTSALAYAHAQGVVHCDVKLENVLVRRCKGMRDLIKLGDWGLARRESSALLLEAPPSNGSDTAGGVLSAGAVASSMELIAATASRLPGSREGRGAEAGALSFFSQDPSGALACGATSRTFAEEMVMQANSSGEATPQPAFRAPSRLEDEKLALLEVAERAAARSATALSAPKGTMCYQPPEAFEEGRRLRRAGTRWAADMWALGCLLWEAATADCLPMGTGDAILGRQALLSEEEWQARLRERMQAFVKAIDALPAARGVPPNVAAEARRGLVGLLSALWQPLPLARPVARDVATLALWHPDKLVLKLPSPALS